MLLFCYHALIHASFFGFSSYLAVCILGKYIEAVFIVVFFLLFVHIGGNFYASKS